MEKENFDKIVKNVDREWNCLKDTPLEFNVERTRKTKKCLMK